MVASCPKCGAPRDEARVACPRCGLATARMDAFAQARDEGVPDALAAAWQRATAAWHEPAHHDEVMRLVTQHDAYAWAAARYREAARDRPDDAIAARALERVRRAAEATLLASRTAREAARSPAPYRMTVAILVLLVVVAIAGFVYALARREGGAPLTPPGTPPPAHEVR